MNTTANPVLSEHFDSEQCWPQLDEADKRLVHLRTLQTKRGLSKQNRQQLIDAVRSFHTVIATSSSILDNTLDLHRDIFKERAAALTSAYLQFCLDVSPKEHVEKHRFLQMLEDKLIKPSLDTA